MGPKAAVDVYTPSTYNSNSPPMRKMIACEGGKRTEAIPGLTSRTGITEAASYRVSIVSSRLNSKSSQGVTCIESFSKLTLKICGPPIPPHRSLDKMHEKELLNKYLDNYSLLFASHLCTKTKEFVQESVFLFFSRDTKISVEGHTAGLVP